MPKAARAKAAPTGKPTARKPAPNVRTPAAPPRRAADDRSAPEEHGTLETVVQAAAELTEIGLRVGARALRSAVSRLPHP
jgi:hypothetical protein